MNHHEHTAALKATREDLIALLASLDIDLPPETMLSKDALEKRLGKALDYVQDIASIIPQSTNVLNIAKLSRWSGEEPAKEAIQRQTRREMHVEFANRLLPGLVPLEDEGFKLVSIRKTLVTLADCSADDHKRVIIQDDNEQSTIVLRVAEIRKFDKQTPVLVVLYAIGTRENLGGKSCVKHQVQQSREPAMVALQIPDQSLLIRLLEANAKRVPKSFEVQREAQEQDFVLSFLLPVAPIHPRHLATLNTRTRCAICEKEADKKCARCHAIVYCGKDCQTIDWKAHKEFCNLLKEATWIPITFTKMQNYPGLEVVSASFYDGEGPITNIHRSDPFVLKLEFHPTQGEKVIWLGDRERTLDVEYQRPQSGPDRGTFDEIAAVLKKQGAQSHKLYCWARRVGDWELLVTVDRLPSQGQNW